MSVFESGTFYTVYHKCKHYGDREAYHQGIEAHHQCILHYLPETGQMEKVWNHFKPTQLLPIIPFPGE